MAKALDTRNKTNSLQRIQAGITVVKELRITSSGSSLTPESRPSTAAVEAEKHLGMKGKRIWGSSTRTRQWEGML
jgi:hypothetical protein